jgi:hypothetical protein
VWWLVESGIASEEHKRKKWGLESSGGSSWRCPFKTPKPHYFWLRVHGTSPRWVRGSKEPARAKNQPGGACWGSLAPPRFFLNFPYHYLSSLVLLVVQSSKCGVPTHKFSSYWMYRCSTLEECRLQFLVGRPLNVLCAFQSFDDISLFLFHFANQIFCVLLPVRFFLQPPAILLL